MENYPLKKECSDLDIELPDKTTDEAYLQLLRKSLKQIIPMVEPELIFFQAGVDILESDKLGRLAVTLKGCKERDKIVFETAKANHIPIVFNMAGGYSEKISIIIEAHANTYRMAQQVFF